MFHYFIDGSGNVQQTSRLEEMVSNSAEWMRMGVNVCFAGNFTQQAPTTEQMASGAQLCAWLLQELGLGSSDVKGAKECYLTDSPGEQWDEGISWRDALLDGIGELLEGSSAELAEIEALRAQVVALQASLASSEQRADTSAQEIGHLSAEIELLHKEISRLEEAADTSALEQQIQTLQAKVASLQASLAAAENENQAALSQRDQLKLQVERLQEDIKRLAEEASSGEELRLQIQVLEAEVEQAQGRVLELQEALDLAQQETPTVSKPLIEDVVEDLPKHETLTYDTRSLDQITHVSVHHSAAAASIDPWQVAAYQIKEDPSRNKDAWPGIGYHYYIGPDGTIYQTNFHETISYHSGGNNTYTVGICFAGSFMEGIPTPKQIITGGHLIAWLVQELRIPVENVWGHKEYPRNSGTSCPGTQWLQGRRWKQMLLTQVSAVQQGLPSPFEKAVPHYLLFWWRSPQLWASGDWVGASRYIAQFQPLCGFSEEQAMRAEYVLIVGGTAGVSPQTEENLRLSGCHVERVDGIDEDDTRRQLDELAASGRPFGTFDIADPWWH